MLHWIFFFIIFQTAHAILYVLVYLAHVLLSSLDGMKREVHALAALSLLLLVSEKRKLFINGRVQFLQFSVLQLIVFCSCATEQEGS